MAGKVCFLLEVLHPSHFFVRKSRSHIPPQPQHNTHDQKTKIVDNFKISLTEHQIYPQSLRGGYSNNVDYRVFYDWLGSSQRRVLNNLPKEKQDLLKVIGIYRMI